MAERSATRAAAQQSQLSQNRYLLLFSGEAHDIQMGITKERSRSSGRSQRVALRERGVR